jgi:hypothetical protein
MGAQSEDRYGDSVSARPATASRPITAWHIPDTAKRRLGAQLCPACWPPADGNSAKRIDHHGQARGCRSSSRFGHVVGDCSSPVPKRAWPWVPSSTPPAPLMTCIVVRVLAPDVDQKGKEPLPPLTIASPTILWGTWGSINIRAAWTVARFRGAHCGS